MVSGPLSPPPQAARSFVEQILGGRFGGPEVVATLDEEATTPTIEFLNSGSKPAANLRFACSDGSRLIATGVVGTLPAGATMRAEIHHVVANDFRCVWLCDHRRGASVWNYAGAYKRFRRNVPDDVALLALMYS